MTAEGKGVEDEAPIEPQNIHNTRFWQQAGVLGDWDHWGEFFSVAPINTSIC